MPLGPAQIHAQQHLGPVLRLGAAGAGLDVQIGRGRIQLACEHAAEFELGERALISVQILADGLQRRAVVFIGRKLGKLSAAGQVLLEPAQGADDLIQSRALLT